MRKDIDISFTPHPLTGDLSIKRDRSAVDQSIKNLVLTNYYERGFNVEVASNVKDSLFDNFTPLIQQTIKNNIIKVLKNFEPGAEVSEVIVEMDRPNEMLVNIYYNYLNDPETRTVIIPLTRIR